MKNRKLAISMKYVLVIGDGMADNPVSALNGKTPLEAASIPTLDALASKGLMGSALTVPPSLPAGSDVAIMSIFGSDPLQYFTGRSPLEAAGCGVKVEPGCASYRCNMICVEDGEQPFGQKRILSHNAGSIEGDVSIEIIETLCAHPEFRAELDRLGMTIYPTPSFRHMAVQKNGEIAGMVLKPPHDILGQTVGDYAFYGNDNAAELWKLMELANALLEHLPINEQRRAMGKKPANGIWFWAEGTAVQLPDFVANYGKQGSVISAVPLVHGIGVLTGLKMVTVEGATGEVDTNYEGKLQAAKDALLAGDDFVAIHLEAPDESTHNGSLPDKLQAIEYLDSRILAPLDAWMREQKLDYRLLVISDHKTLMSTRTHDGDPVPFLLYDSREDRNTGLCFSEKSGETGPYVEPGTKLMELLFAEGQVR